MAVLVVRDVIAHHARRVRRTLVHDRVRSEIQLLGGGLRADALRVLALAKAAL